MLGGAVIETARLHRLRFLVSAGILGAAGDAQASAESKETLPSHKERARINGNLNHECRITGATEFVIAHSVL